MAQGLGATLSSVITVAGRFGTAPASASFDVPLVQGWGNMPASRVIDISTAVTGSGFGTWTSSVTSRIGGTGAESSSWVSDSMLLCSVAPESGATLRVVLTVTRQTGSSLPLFSVDAPVLAMLARDSYILSAPVTVVGVGFHAEGHATPRSRFGGTGAATSHWLSASTLLCRPLPALGASLSVVVTAGEVAGSLSGAFSFSGPHVHRVHGSDTGSGTGGNVALLVGERMGNWDVTMGARVGGTTAEASIWQSESFLLCKVPAGVGKHLLIAVTAEGQVGSLQAAWHVEAPAMTNTTSNGPAAFQPIPITMSGSHWGVVDHSLAVRVGGTAAVATAWESDSSLSCRAGTSRGGARHPLVVSLGPAHSRNISQPAAFSFDSPSVRSAPLLPLFHLSGSGVQVNSPASRFFSGPSGDISPSAEHVELVDVLGDSFGAEGVTPHVRVGLTASEGSFWVSDSSIISRLPWGRAPEVRSAIVVSLALQRGTDLTAFSFAPPVIHAVQPGNAPRSGHHVLTVLGENFGTYEQSAWVKIGNTACLYTEWHSDSRLLCLVSPGVATRVTLYLEDTRGEFHGDDGAFTFDKQSFTNVATNLPISGNYDVTVPGVSFGVWQDSHVLRGGATSAQSTNWISDTSIEARISAGVGATHSLTMTIARHAESASNVFSYDVPNPSVPSASAANLPSSSLPGLTERPFIRLAGHNFGHWDDTPSSRVGVTATQRVSPNYVWPTCTSILPIACNCNDVINENRN